MTPIWSLKPSAHVTCDTDHLVIVKLSEKRKIKPRGENPIKETYYLRFVWLAACSRLYLVCVWAPRDKGSIGHEP